MTLMKMNHRPASRFFETGVENWLGEFEKTFNQKWNTSIPANIVETEEGYHLELLAAGRTKEQFSIEVKDNNLEIASTQPEQKEEDLKFVRREFSLGSFKRSFYLAELVDEDGIQAKYESGILKVFLPKKPEARPVSRQISIQ